MLNYSCNIFAIYFYCLMFFYPCLKFESLGTDTKNKTQFYTIALILKYKCIKYNNPLKITDVNLSDHACVHF